MRTNSIGVCLLLWFQFLTLSGARFDLKQMEAPGGCEQGLLWVDSVYGTLSNDQRIAQMFWVEAKNFGKVAGDHELIGLVKKWQPGGVICFDRDPGRVAEMSNYLQSCSKVPLWLAAGSDWFDGRSCPDVHSFPGEMALEAVCDKKIIYQLGREMARQFREMGLNVFLTSVPEAEGVESGFFVAGDGSFTSRKIIEEKGDSLFQGLREGGVVPAHIKGQTLMMGDVNIVVAEELPVAIRNVKKELAKGSIHWKQVEEQCRRSLLKKFEEGLSSCSFPDEEGLMDRLNQPSVRLLQRRLFEQSATVLVNKNRIIPLENLDNGAMACVVVGEVPIFESRVNDYIEMPVIHVDVDSKESVEKALERIKDYDRLVVGISPGEVVANPANREALVEAFVEKSSVVIFLGGTDQLAGWKGLHRADGLLIAYENKEMSQDVAAQILFGGVGACGRLPIAIKGLFPKGCGQNTEGGIRLKYSPAETVGFDSNRIKHRVDSIVNKGLEERAFPGCQVLVACKGSVIFSKAYGFHTYQKRTAVDIHDLYDLASVTKIAGPLPMIMKLTADGIIDMDAPVSNYYDEWRNRIFHPSNKEGLLFRDVLAHQAGLMSYINYWPLTIKKGHYSHRWFRSQKEDGFSLRVSQHLYLKDRFFRRVNRYIRKSDLMEHGQYQYSGLSFMIFPAMISQLTGQNYAQLLDSLFYRPLGASTLKYNPLEAFALQRVVPTEMDHHFRKEQVHGFVHDEAAAVLGGVSGNAGLFSSANDLAKLLQMYLNGGAYGGKRFLSEAVIEEFSSVQFPENQNRRGLGFDKPLSDNNLLSPDKAYPAPGVSPKSYGHSGFTGTFVWVDPVNELIYVFLSNRVFPTRENKAIYNLNIRTSVQQVFYDDLSF